MPRVWRIRCEAGDLVAQITQIDNGSLCVICDLFYFLLAENNPVAVRRSHEEQHRQ